MAEINLIDKLLGAEPASEITQKVNIERFGEFTVRALTAEEINKIREEATRYEIKGKERKAFVDETELGLLMVVKATVEPDFSDKRLLKHFDAKTATQCVQKALLAGELAQLTQAVVAVSGLGDDDDELIEEAKN